MVSPTSRSSAGQPRARPRPDIPDWVAQQYYRHGLFCASHPKVVLLFTALGMAWTCYPLLSLQQLTSGQIQRYIQPANGSTAEPSPSAGPPPAWWLGSRPVAYLLQVQMKAMVHPYPAADLVRTDAFRGPLASAFKLQLEDLGPYRTPDGKSLEDECLRTDGLSTRYKSSSAVNVLPEYGCLAISPANVWRKDPSAFQMDANIVATVFNYQRSREGHSSLADLMFGMRQRDTGLTQYPMRNRQRVLTYAVTLALKNYDSKFVQSLRSHLQDLYPLHAENNSQFVSDELVHVYYPSRSYYTELLPFCLVLLLLFLYVYFSCNKIELVRSKMGIAFAAVCTVVGAILMALGLSGLSLNMSSVMCVIPYLVAFISLENIMVLTRSVSSTPPHLDVKIRVAQGLSREGWNITKNLFAEITILTLGFFIGIMDPSIQEFSLLAVMGLLSDFFLQTFFFTTVLSMDMSFLELRDVIQKPNYKRQEIFRHPVSGPGLIKKSVDHDTNVVAPQCSTLVPNVESKRVRFINFWAKRRIVQRLFVIGMIVWISLFVYQSDLLDKLFQSTQQPDLPDDNDSEIITQRYRPEDIQEPTQHDIKWNISETYPGIDSLALSKMISSPGAQPPNQNLNPKSTETLNRLQYGPAETWKKLPPSHWSMLFGLYNMSLFGEYVTFLPPIRLSLAISPESASQLRHPEELQVHSMSSEALDFHDKILLEQDVDDFDGIRLDQKEHVAADGYSELSPFVPTSPGELFLAFVFAFPSMLFLVYVMIVFYRCVCSRNYAEWRSSWEGGQSAKQNHDIYTQVVQESVPIVLEGHKYDVEGLVTDAVGNLMVSLCLEGTIRTWDSYTGEKLAEIDRHGFFHHRGQSNHDCQQSHVETLETQGPAYGSDLRPTLNKSVTYDASSAPPSPPLFKINTNFSSIQKNKITCSIDPDHPPSKKPFNFGSFISDTNFVGSLSPPNSQTQGRSSSNSSNESHEVLSSVWCMDCSDQLILVGCAHGRIEAWDARTGAFKCAYDDGTGIGVTHIKMIGHKVVLARLAGYIEFLELASTQNLEKIPRMPKRNLPDTPARRYHVRSHSGISLDNGSDPTMVEDIYLAWLQAIRAHQQPVSCLEYGGGRVLTGSMDHTIRIFRLEDHFNIYTLHGHCGPISTAFVDGTVANCAGSGSQDGMICVWDLLTGACMYSILAHDGEVLCLTYSPSYVISMGSDSKLCVWERFQGHLINTILLDGGSFSRDIIMLTHNLMVTSRKCDLVVWDARLPDPVKIVRLGEKFGIHSVKMMKHLGDTIACNFGNQLRLIHFPLLSDKKD
ncbi:hypothetical protein TCAL_05977 [Tigriopus californicus]|uniref:Sterol regulatory element-binding protein cleavage-activating protein n=1 Tax=Tigriopus californicus TaxID=6832 RepID=A0A553PN55_TIGCA|nr:sterol regulatory element-binding protein cleavage-activating protein-like [Tigriopus californicus]TRY79121.1 hypothetical protein TCAL_05977 [Tigriopus californicus]